jgi:hypothetical protein
MLSDGINKPEERPHEKAPDIGHSPAERICKKKPESQSRACLCYYPKTIRKSSHKGELK